MKITTDIRPWGEERCLTENEKSTVKLLYINKGESLSLQKHKFRDEFWKIIIGNPEAIIGDKKLDLKPGDECNIPREVAHQISAPVDNVVFLEISTGEFDEKDEVRLEDKYNRL